MTFVSKNLLFGLAIAVLCVSSCQQNNSKTESNKTEISSVPTGTLEVFAELDINPGNVAVSKDGRVFMTVHPLRRQDLQLVEVKPDGTYTPFPNLEKQTENGVEVTDGFDTPLGVISDDKDRLWVIDAGLSLGKSRLFAFDIETGQELFRFNIPEELAPNTSFVQDLAIDDKNEWAYLADFGNPGIIAVDIKNEKFRKFSDTTMISEDIDMVIDGKVQLFQGAPARVGINPITISEDKSQVFYGAMNGTSWYSIETIGFLENKSDSLVQSSIQLAGPKPISDGVETLGKDIHYFTNLGNNSIDVLSNGNLETLIKDSKIDWPDNVRLGPDNWLYIAVNQLHKSPAFTGGDNTSTAPYLILRVKI